MKTTCLILTILALVLINPLDLPAKTDNTSALDSQLIHKQALKTITIVTPHSEIYDDGCIKRSFVGYSLSDINDNLLIKVASVRDIPVTLKIKEGTYKIRLNNQNSANFFITVTTEPSQEFQIQE